jgi:predicted DNA-binding protein (MmcQ/YjbR family)
MNVEEIRQICIAKRGVTEGFPFDEMTLVLKVGGKMFALLNLDKDPSVNLKCDPDRAIDLRERYDAILPGYHMNKQHWNTVMLEGSVPQNLFIEMINHSYDLVFKSLSKNIRSEIESL